MADDTIRCRRIELVDDTGRARILLEAGDTATRIVLLGADGVPRVLLEDSGDAVLMHAEILGGGAATLGANVDGVGALFVNGSPVAERQTRDVEH